MLPSQTACPFEPVVDVTVRNIEPLEPTVALVRQAALARAALTGDPGPYVVLVEGLPNDRVFVTLRLGREESRPEWGLNGPDVASAVRGAFQLVGSDLRAAS